ncbi:hypothetical protein [Nitrosomonas ureae]|uniref:Uncharacterized protein n=1 Tax=Nitrosomonas ureae TaxID=44577 RepID=A0A1H9AQW3_9PROT|nr:hypothetical protein [Nitrosomonas ureae]SEP78847.1 hypothetical protein SAMN05421510_100497 [Nitrosomonas ureae]
MHSVFCLNDGKDFKTNNLINAADVLIKNRFSLQIDNKEIINERQVFDLRSIKIGGDLWIDIKNYNAANDPTDQFYLIRSSEINGDFNLSGDIEGDIDARNLHVNGSCYINAIIRNTIDLSGLVVKDDVEFYPTIYGTADLSSIHVRGSLFLSQNYERYNEINSLKFVQKTTPEDKHKFIELQNNKEEFLNHCFNNPLCSLILKRAVIEKELRIHQLTIDLGNFDPNRIYWRERFREFFRKLVRFTIRIVKCLPGKLSPYGQVKLRVILDRLHGISAKRVKIIQCSDKLSFYPRYRWLRCYVEQTVYDHHARGVVNCLWNSSTKKLVILGGISTPIHKLNNEGMLTLETDDQVKDYLRFFCECVWGETGGPFHIYETAHKTDTKSVSTHAKPLEIIEKNENEWKITAQVIYAGKLFKSSFLISKNGAIEMPEDENIQGISAKSFFHYETPYQYLLYKLQDQSYAEAASTSFRPMQFAFNSPLSRSERKLAEGMITEQLNTKLKIKEFPLYNKKTPEIIFASDELSFYPGFYWIKIFIQQIHNSQPDSTGGLIDCLWKPEENKLVILGGSSKPIHELNSANLLSLNKEKQVKDYLRFFCECVWGEEGPFHIYEEPRTYKFAPHTLHLSPRQDRGVLRRRKPETAHYAYFKNTNYNVPRGKTTGNREFDDEEIKKHTQAIQIIKEEPVEGLGKWKAEASVIYSHHVFRVTFLVHTNGNIVMTDDKPLQSSTKKILNYTPPYLLISKKDTENLSFPLLKRWNDNAIPSHLNSKELIKQISKEIEDLPDLPYKNDDNKKESESTGFLTTIINAAFSYLIEVYKNRVYSGTGNFRNRLSRFGFSLSARLPIIDLRGAHVKTLNDRRGHGWRNPDLNKELKISNNEWLNYGIFLRLEGFTFNNLISILEKKVENSIPDSLTEEFIPDSITEKFNDSGEHLNNSNDQSWESRAGWLYRQYPQGVPDPITFHQQPFSQFARAYRTRGDTSNLNGILRTKISIEFMLFAQRVTPVFLLIFSLLAGSIFALSTYWTESINDNLSPVLQGLAAGIFGSILFCPKREKSIKNLFLFFLFAFILTYAFIVGIFQLDSRGFSIVPPGKGIVLLTQIIFLSIVIWGILGSLFIYFFQILYWGCFDYGLSLYRAFATIAICVAIGAWCVDYINKKGFLVLDAQYAATQFIEGETQPRFTQIKPAPNDISMMHIDHKQTMPRCGDTIDPLMYATDVFISLIDFRQEFRCNIRSTAINDEEKKAEWGLLLEETTWSGRMQHFSKAFSTHPQTWIWLEGFYTILGWAVISLTILTATRVIRNNSGDNHG